MPRPAAHRLVTLALLAGGVALFYGLFGHDGTLFVTLGVWGPVALAGFLLAVAVAVSVPPTAGLLSAALNGLRAAVAAGPVRSAVVAGAVTAAYLYATAAGQGRSFRPYVHDEFSYLVQAHQFATGHLWHRPHPLAPSFDTFQVLDGPAYASAYFPGTALLYVPGVWLHLPPWVTSLAIAGAVAGLLFRVAAAVLDDGAAAAVAVLLLWDDVNYRSLSTMVMAQLPLLLWGLSATAAWLAWRAGGRRRHALALGVCLAMAAVTRPVDALCFAGPIGVAVVVAVARRRRPVLTLALMAAPAVPLLLLQLSLDRGITGEWFRTPFRLYADRDYPGTAYGFHAVDPAARPASPLPQKQALYDEYRPLVRDHRPGEALVAQVRTRGPGMPARLPVTLTQLSVVPFALLLAVVPVAAAGLTGPAGGRRAVVLAGGVAFQLLYVGYAFFFPHYALTAAPAVILAVLIAAEQLAALPPRRAAGAAVAAPLVLAGLALAGLPQLDPSSASDDLFDGSLVADVDRQLATIGHRPAVVVFTYFDGRDANAEPVYNADVGWPDDAPVVRAHDLGPSADRALFAYYAGRFAYRYDEQTRTLIPLGPAAELAR